MNTEIAILKVKQTHTEAYASIRSGLEVVGAGDGVEGITQRETDVVVEVVSIRISVLIVLDAQIAVCHIVDVVGEGLTNAAFQREHPHRREHVLEAYSYRNHRLGATVTFLGRGTHRWLAVRSEEAHAYSHKEIRSPTKQVNVVFPVQKVILRYSAELYYRNAKRSIALLGQGIVGRTVAAGEPATVYSTPHAEVVVEVATVEYAQSRAGILDGKVSDQIAGVVEAAQAEA